MEKPNPKQRHLLKVYKKTLTLSQPLFEIALGVMLGDASLQTQNGGLSYRLKFSQAEKLHREYLLHLHDVFADWVLSPPFFNEKRQMWSFQTFSHCDFNKIAQLFVIDDDGLSCKKTIKPDLIQKYVTPRSLAYWWMDDGGKSCYNKDYQRKGFVFNTQGFTLTNVRLLCDGLTQKFGLHCWPKPNKKGFLIVISALSYDKMMCLLDPYLIPSMRYKLPLSFTEKTLHE